MNFFVVEINDEMDLRIDIFGEFSYLNGFLRFGRNDTSGTIAQSLRFTPTGAGVKHDEPAVKRRAKYDDEHAE